MLHLDVPWEACPFLKRKQGVTIGRGRLGREEGNRGRDAKERRKEREEERKEGKTNRIEQSKQTNKEPKKHIHTDRQTQTHRALHN